MISQVAAMIPNATAVSLIVLAGLLKADTRNAPAKTPPMTIMKILVWLRGVGDSGKVGIFLWFLRFLHYAGWFFCLFGLADG